MLLILAMLLCSVCFAVFASVTAIIPPHFQISSHFSTGISLIVKYEESYG
jgi:hypothetical protein